MDDLRLAAEFPAATRETWLRLVKGVLKGGDFETLVAPTYDGIRIEPLYGKAEATPTPRATQGRWRVAQRVDHPDAEAANALVLADLKGGADALTVVFAGAPTTRGFGLAVRTLDDLDEALRGVMLDLVQVRLEAGHGGWAAADLMVMLADRRRHALADLDLDLGLDPIGALAASGHLDAAWDTIAAHCADTLSRLGERGFKGRPFLADGRPYHEAGAGEAQELAGVLATALAYLRALEAGGHSLETARDALSFLLVADADEFLTVAKFRALRRLWARVEDACGLAPKPIRLHGETAWRMTTRRDPWVNMLRATVAVFSAGLGGADGITVLPFTMALGLPDAFARRMARNTQLILLEESNLWRVTDPAAGAGAFEALTEALCEMAWRLLQDIEREGGMVGSLASGALQARIAAVRSARAHAVATRADPITGTSEFPDIHEAPVSVLIPSPSQAGLGPGGGTASEAIRPGEPSPTRPRETGEKEHATAITPLPSIRAAERYERLRDASDAQLARTGARPKVFLANLGTAADFTPRATFAKNFFEAGGIEAVSNNGFTSHDDMLRAFAASSAKLACLCSSDEVYSDQAAPAARALSGAGARALYVAGRPGRLQEHLGAGSVTAYLFAECDALAILSDALEKAA